MADVDAGSLATVLHTVRAAREISRPDIARSTGLGRAAVAQRLSVLMESGLVEDGELAPSMGGRPSRQVRFRSGAGVILAAELGATSIGVGVTDLLGNLLEHVEEPADITDGPEKVLGRVEQLIEERLLPRLEGVAEVWGVGVGLPGPVEYRTGRPMAPPIMPGWDGYDVRGRFVERFGAPTWVDNDVNVMALGELRSGLAVGSADVLYIKVGSGIGAGLISGGRLHRGAQGVAGDIGHIAITDDSAVICRCGKTGCLEAVSGGAALGRLATAAGHDRTNVFLKTRLSERGHLSARDLVDGAARGDTFCVNALISAGRQIGLVTAKLVNFYNPSLILVGGGVAASGDILLAAIREAIYQQSLPLATRDLRIARSPLGKTAGLRGAAYVVLDELFEPHRLVRWLHAGSSRGLRDMSADPTLTPIG